MALVGDISGKGEREELKRELKAEIRREDRKRRIVGFLVRLAVKLALLAAVAAMIAALVAKSGWYDVPLLSSWLYRPAEPVREVRALVGYSPEGVAAAVMAKAEYDQTVGEFRISLSEQDLTTLLSSALKDSAAESPLEFSYVQAAITPDGLEFMAVTPRPGRDVPIFLRIVPTADEGRLSLDVRDMTVGSLKTPGFLVRLVSRGLSGQLSKALPTENLGLGDLLEVRTDEGQMFLTFQPSLKLPLR